MKLHEWARTTGAECVINELVSDEQKKMTLLWGYLFQNLHL